MTSRILNPDEYLRLAGTPAEGAVTHFTPATRVVVVEDDDGKLLGCEVFQPILHGEFLWIHPQHRGKSSVARRLWKAMKDTVKREFSVEWFATGCDSDQVRELLCHVKAHKLPDHYMVPVGEVR